MTDQPPAKRLKQSSIFEALRKRGNQKKGSPEKKADEAESCVVMDDPENDMNVDREKVAHAAEIRMQNQDGSTEQTKDSELPDSQKSKSSPGGACADSLEELFDSDTELEDLPDTLQDDDSAMPNIFKGVLVTELPTTPGCLPPLGKLAPSANHTVMIKVPYNEGKAPLSDPDTCQDKWDGSHVRLPCSSENLYPVETKKGKSLKNRWEVIQEALLNGISSSYDLEEAILSYNSHKWDFRGLHSFFSEVLVAKESTDFIKNTLPKMVELALQLPQLCTQGIPLLKKHKSHSITMSQHQAASLLANAFFCTFPRRNTTRKQSEYSSYPDINFNSLFQGSRHPKSHRKAEKLKCLVNYFKRVTTEMPKGTLTFTRQVLVEFPKWQQSTAQLTKLHITATGTIEDHGIGMLQVDFANKYLGGGVLGYGCVQEEIRFLICPELILSKLFTEVLDRNECLIMTGSERFSDYRGYADSFHYSGDYTDTTPRDSWGRMCTELVAIDALVFNSYPDQFHANLVKRELNKAYCGFMSPGVAPDHMSAVATGNWGCGAFGGDVMLKALIQLMAAAEAKRDVCYFTFHNFELVEELHKVYELITSKELAVSDLFSLIQQYYDSVCLKSNRTRKPVLNLYDFFHRVYSDQSTDSTDPDNVDDESSREAKYHTKGNQSPDYAADTP